MMRRPLRTVPAFVAATLLLGCGHTPTGRHQLQFFPADQVAKMGQTAFVQMKQQTPVAQGDATSRYVACVAQSITAVVPKPQGGGKWDITVFKDDQVNAFALPGGGIGVYMGLLKAARTPDQLAAVIGHEIGHVQASHANARLSTQYATEAGLSLIQSLAGKNPEESRNIMALLGMGAQVGILLPFSRADESEADLLGMQYMAQAGYDPREAIALWQNMQQIGGARPPTWLSTHPSSEQRIANLRAQMPQALKLYQPSRKPGCAPAR